MFFWFYKVLTQNYSRKSYSVSNIYVDENKESLPVQRIKGGVEDTVNLSFAGEFRYLDTKGSNLSQIEDSPQTSNKLNNRPKSLLFSGRLLVYHVSPTFPR